MKRPQTIRQFHWVATSIVLLGTLSSCVSDKNLTISPANVLGQNDSGNLYGGILPTPTPTPTPSPTPTQTSTATGPAYYIRPSTSGGGNGSDWTNACNGFSGACDPAHLVRGATYYVAGGSYTGNLTFQAPESGTSLITIQGATSANHGTSSGWKNSYSVSVADGGQQAIFASGLVFNTSYWVVDGTVGTGQANSTSANNYGFGIHYGGLGGAGGIAATFPQGAKSITLSHFEADGVNWDVPQDNGYAIAFYVSGGQCADFDNGLTFDHDYVHDMKGSAWLMGGNITIQYSNIVRVRSTPAWHGEGIASRADCGTGQSDHETFRYNVWQDVNGTGSIVALYNTGRNWQVYGNVFYATGAHCTNCNGMGPTVVDNTSQGYIIGLKYYNNTVYNTDGKCGVYSTNTSGSSGYDIRNNVFYGCKGGVSFGTSGADYVLDYNVTWNNYVYFCDGTSQCPGAHDNYICGTQQPCYFNVGTAPAASSLFVNPSAYDLRLNGNTISGNSMLGTNLGAPYNVDMNGKTRVNWTRGAFEF